ncbi:hypothetical protein Pan97_51930 [Bremerella volcania]|uniref:Uncharacterized protein n=1 Tax=Bremerella volcania TaxID=2527984 RepID=A0A518CFU6_9BACT|nr:hypothetical protein [Bremerella volcania]QDU78112.1 hypothetical protein Pan97_51930 [Bremerella volcania]
MSKFEHPYIEHAEYLEFVVPEEVRDEEAFKELLQAMVEATKKTGKRRIFVDRGQSDKTVRTDPMVIYRMAVRMGEAFGASVRIAAFSHWADQDTFWEDVATNRGAIVRASSDRASLLTWLLQED